MKLFTTLHQNEIKVFFLFFHRKVRSPSVKTNSHGDGELASARISTNKTRAIYLFFPVQNKMELNAVIFLHRIRGPESSARHR